jgi:hypothetical protein
VQTSIRLALTALAISGVTLVASGAPLPFSAKDPLPTPTREASQSAPEIPALDLASLHVE